MPTKKSKGPGRPTSLTKGVQDSICKSLSNGAYREPSARAAGISISSFSRWLERGEEDEEKGRENIYTRFRRAVITAEAEAEVALVGTIRGAVGEQWQAGAWLLERKHPDRWGRRDRHTIDASVGVQADVEVVHSRVVEVIPEAAQRLEIVEVLGRALQIEAHTSEPSSNGH